MDAVKKNDNGEERGGQAAGKEADGMPAAAKGAPVWRTGRKERDQCVVSVVCASTTSRPLCLPVSCTRYLRSGASPSSSVMVI